MSDAKVEALVKVRDGLRMAADAINNYRSIVLANCTFFVAQHDYQGTR